MYEPYLRPMSTSKLSGLDLFKLKSKRDYTNSEDDNYAQLLFTMYTNIGDALFPLLEQAEQQNKKLYFITDEKHPESPFTRHW